VTQGNALGSRSIERAAPDLERYIGRQREHHRAAAFQDEFRMLLVKYEIEFDERFVWD
jgi:hypothetical protein